MVDYKDALIYARWAVTDLKWIDESECEKYQEEWRANECKEYREKRRMGAVEYLRKALDNLLPDDSDKED